MKIYYQEKNHENRRTNRRIMKKTKQEKNHENWQTKRRIMKIYEPREESWKLTEQLTNQKKNCENLRAKRRIMIIILKCIQYDIIMLPFSYW